MKSKKNDEKVRLTLGELYRRMSADFRAVRPADHAACVMPMVVASSDDGENNWTVEPLTSFCPFCRALSEMIASQYAARFEVRYFVDTQRSKPPLALGYYCAAD